MNKLKPVKQGDYARLSHDPSIITKICITGQGNSHRQICRSGWSGLELEEHRLKMWCLEKLRKTRKYSSCI